MTVAELIKKTRTDGNMTQEEYGLKFGVTRQTVSSWENGRSMPDLQMLIDICNTYHISLDKLLNENEEFVSKIDFWIRIVRRLRYIFAIAVLALLVYGVFVVEWRIRAAKVNETFAANAKQTGFVIEDRIYVQEINGVHYWLPNCELAFLKKDFGFKHAYAQDENREIEIKITYAEEDNVLIEFDHDETIDGIVNADGKFVVDKTTMSQEDEKLYNESEKQVQKIVKELKRIYDAVY